jgi:hypothetical protein
LDQAERDLRGYFRKHRGQLISLPGERLTDTTFRIARLAAEALKETGAAWWSGYEKSREVENPAAFDPPRRKTKVRPELIRVPAGRHRNTLMDRPWNPPSLRRASRPWGRGGARRHVGPTPPTLAENKCMWLDTSTAPPMLKEYVKKSQSWRSLCEVHTSERAADKFLAGGMGPVTWHLVRSWPVVMTSLRDFIAQMVHGDVGRAGKSGRPAYLACATLAILLDTSPDKIADLLANYRRSARHR